jgi:hypothetical protein
VFNMLPSDNVYTAAAMRANPVYQRNNWAVRVAAVRMLQPGQLEVALVVPTDGSGTMRAALDRLPGHEPVFEVVSKLLAFCHHPVRAAYFSEAMWLEASASSTWRYYG